jgi:predicted ATPase
VFNEGLTCVIGGKSTGKSLLLRTIAHAIDDEYANGQEMAAGIMALPRLPDAEVTWADGTTGRRRFIYVPQAYLNRLVDDPQHRTRTDEIIENVLLQDETRKAAHDKMERDLTTLKGKAFSAIQAYRDLRDRRDEQRGMLDRDGSWEVFSSAVSRLEKERDAMAKESHVTENEVARYEELGLSIDRLAETEAALEEDRRVMREMPSPVVVIPGHVILHDTNKLEHSFAGMSDTSARKVEGILEEGRIAVEGLWDKARAAMLDDLESMSESYTAEMARLEEERAPLRNKVEQSARLREVTGRLDEERRKQEVAKEREAAIERYEESMSSLKRQLLGVRDEARAAIEKYCSVVNGSVEERSGLEFSARPVWRLDDFTSALLGQVNNRSLSQFRQVFGTDLREIGKDDLDDKFFSNLWDALENPLGDGGLPTKSGFTFWTAIQLLTENWYNVHYIVRSGGDELESMSPGKKSLVLLELIIDLDGEMCPLLIDQPEDDLDNRSVYNELVAYIRRRKACRQIIIVTHNANVVLGTDAEEVIIANQEGVGTPNASRRFEYRSGAIENNDVKRDGSGGILYGKGLQAQMCDILEGGPEALERRRRKYTSASLEWTV